MDINELKKEDNKSGSVNIHYRTSDLKEGEKHETGTKIILRVLKHHTPLEVEKIKEGLARRFSRETKGHMNIFINGDLLTEPKLDYRFEHEWVSESLPDGNVVKYRYACAQKPIRSAELRGFTIYARGKTVQAPPFFFHVEATAHGQHGTRYLIGEIEANFIDKGIDDESDIVSTDRQEIDWENPLVSSFYEWGQAISRRAIAECATKVGEDVKNFILEQPEILSRIERLEPASQKQIAGFLTLLGKGVADTESKDRIIELADALVKAYEFRNFHDVIKTLEQIEAEDDPDKLQHLLTHLTDWRVLESRAILEIVKGRLEIIDKFDSMILKRDSETANPIGTDNFHDLLGSYPWLINPEWQVYAEEKRITTQLREWGASESTISKEDKTRFDFLGLQNSNQYIIIEIKRPGYGVTYEEVTRMDSYREKLSGSRDIVKTVLIYGGSFVASDKFKKSIEEREDFELLTWQQLVERSRKYYEHYRAVLEGDIGSANFTLKETEVMNTRKVIDTGTVYRTPSERKKGLGPQDVSYEDKVE